MRLLSCVVVLVPALLMAGQSHAASVGISAGAAAWNQSPGGSARINRQGDRVNLEDDMDLDRSSNGFVWVQWDHRLPLVPNLKLRYTRISSDGSGTVQRSFRFGDLDVTVDERVRGSMKLEQVDAIAYYGLRLSALDINLGVNVKHVNGELELQRRSDGSRKRGDFRDTLPLAWARLRLDVPGTGLYASGEAGGAAWDGDRILDVAVQAGYDWNLGPATVGLLAGWKHQELRRDSFDRNDISIRARGPYAGLQAGF